MGDVMARHHQELPDKHPSVGLVRNIGLFGIVELVRSRETMEPMAPFNGSSDEMKAVGKHLDERGLFTMVRWNGIMTNPPLCHHRGAARRGLRRSSTRRSTIADAAVA